MEPKKFVLALGIAFLLLGTFLMVFVPGVLASPTIQFSDDFESGTLITKGWDNSYPSYVYVSSDNAHSGTYSVEINGGAGNVNQKSSGISQTFPVQFDLWFYIDTLPSTGKAILIQQDSNTGWPIGPGLAVYNGGGLYQLINRYYASGWHEEDINNTISLGVWYHLFVNATAIDSYMVFLDDVKQGSTWTGSNAGGSSITGIYCGMSSVTSMKFFIDDYIMETGADNPSGGGTIVTNWFDANSYLVYSGTTAHQIKVQYAGGGNVFIWDVFETSGYCGVYDYHSSNNTLHKLFGGAFTAYGYDGRGAGAGQWKAFNVNGSGFIMASWGNIFSYWWHGGSWVEVGNLARTPKDDGNLDFYELDQVHQYSDSHGNSWIGADYMLAYRSSVDTSTYLSWVFFNCSSGMISETPVLITNHYCYNLHISGPYYVGSHNIWILTVCDSIESKSLSYMVEPLRNTSTHNIEGLYTTLYTELSILQSPTNEVGLYGYDSPYLVFANQQIKSYAFLRLNSDTYEPTWVYENSLNVNGSLVSQDGCLSLNSYSYVVTYVGGSMRYYSINPSNHYAITERLYAKNDSILNVYPINREYFAFTNESYISGTYHIRLNIARFQTSFSNGNFVGTPRSGAINTTVTFTYIPSGSYTSYPDTILWDVNGDGIYEGNGTQFSYNYLVSGYYTVKCYANNSLGQIWINKTNYIHILANGESNGGQDNNAWAMVNSGLIMGIIWLFIIMFLPITMNHFMPKYGFFLGLLLMLVPLGIGLAESGFFTITFTGIIGLVIFWWKGEL